MVYTIKIACISWAFLCQPIPQTVQHVSAKTCDAALLAVAHEWKPFIGAYAFKCEKRK